MVVSSLRKAGPIVVVQNILKGLNRNVIEVEIVKLMQDEPQRSITSEFVEAGYIVHEIGTTKLTAELRPGFIAKKLDKLIQERKPDIIHLHGYQCNRVVTRLKSKLPKIETVHCILAEDYKHYGLLRGKYMIANHLRGMKRIDNLIAISDSVKAYCERELRRTDIGRIYNGVSNPIEWITKDQARRNIGVEPECTLFVVVGSLTLRKDPETVIWAFKNAFTEEHNVRLMFLGKGDLMSHCKDIVGNDSRIEFMGWKPNVYEYIKAADYSICASHSEGFGLNFIESLVNGTPVIGSNIEAFREFYERYPQIKQFVFNPGDVNKLAQNLLMAYNTTLDMQPISKDTLRVFGCEAMGDNYTELYKGLCSRAVTDR